MSSADRWISIMYYLSSYNENYSTTKVSEVATYSAPLRQEPK